MANDQGSTLFNSLISRGLSPVHAAALVGNMQQESSFDPTAVNRGEDAHGLIQWRGDRWQALQDFAKQRGTDPTDRDTQLDFIGHEMGGAERKAGSRFMAAEDLPGANDALKSYIRYGDNSAATRLANASKVLGAPTTEGSAPVQSAPVLAAGPAPAVAPPPVAQTGMLSGMPGLEPGGAPSAPSAPLPVGPVPASGSPQAAPDLMAQSPIAAPQPLNMPLTAQAKARLFAALAAPRQ